MSFWLYILFSQRCQKNVGEVEVVTDLDDYFNSRIDEGEGSLKNDDDRTKVTVKARVVNSVAQVIPMKKVVINI